ncbi:MAG: hypothetical protein AAF911_11000 [Planctomycetota bacterium]
MPRTATKKTSWQKLVWCELRFCWKNYRAGTVHYLGEYSVAKTRDSHAAAMKKPAVVCMSHRGGRLRELVEADA